jgi:photosystem II stability/assembly factor-like uncharacterized protein
MQKARSANRRLLTLAAVVATAVLGGSAAAGVSSASNSSPTRATVSIVPAAPQTVTATLITRPHGTLKPGTRVRTADLGQRVFPNPRVGFTLASVGEAQYPAATANGGRTWRTDGPALHLNAAQAPFSVAFPGAASARTFFAFGGGQVVDATGDAGKHWSRSFPALVVASSRSPRTRAATGRPQ